MKKQKLEILPITNQSSEVVMLNKKLICGALAGILLISGCATTIPPEALKFNPDTLANRQLQARKFDTKNEKELLSAAAAVLQDLGFNLDESAPGIGVLVGSKKRDARDSGQIAGQIMLGLLFGASAMSIDSEQLIRASLITKPAENGNGYILRVTFQRVVWNQNKQVSKIEAINDIETYKGFFDKLSKSVFLEAQNI
ncbi:hypothetical protein [Polynucleobacter cosmopolitanus]|nr:hypothetical protein [Polynucleobacter cosmopolitanus]